MNKQRGDGDEESVMVTELAGFVLEQINWDGAREHRVVSVQ